MGQGEHKNIGSVIAGCALTSFTASQVTVLWHKQRLLTRNYLSFHQILGLLWKSKVSWVLWSPHPWSLPGNGLPRRAGRQWREKRAGLFPEHCPGSQEGKQDLAFIGVILGNRGIDSQIFILSECVSVAPIVPRGHPVPCQHYPYTLNTGKVLTLAWLNLLHFISSLVVCRIMNQAAYGHNMG